MPIVCIPAILCCLVLLKEHPATMQLNKVKSMHTTNENYQEIFCVSKLQNASSFAATWTFCFFVFSKQYNEDVEILRYPADVVEPNVLMILLDVRLLFSLSSE